MILAKRERSVSQRGAQRAMGVCRIAADDVVGDLLHRGKLAKSSDKGSCAEVHRPVHKAKPLSRSNQDTSSLTGSFRCCLRTILSVK